MKSLLGKTIMSCVALAMLSSLSFGQRYYHHWNHDGYNDNDYYYHHHYWTHDYWMRHHYWEHHQVYWRDNGAGYWGWRNGVHVWIRL